MNTSETVHPAGALDRFRRLAWDTDVTWEILERHPEWLVRRVLDYGQWEDFQAVVAWLGWDRMVSAMRGLRCDTPRARRLCEVLEG